MKTKEGINEQKKKRWLQHKLTGVKAPFPDGGFGEEEAPAARSSGGEKRRQQRSQQHPRPSGSSSQQVSLFSSLSAPTAPACWSPGPRQDALKEAAGLRRLLERNSASSWQMFILSFTAGTYLPKKVQRWSFLKGHDNGGRREGGEYAYVALEGTFITL